VTASIFKTIRRRSRT